MSRKYSFTKKASTSEDYMLSEQACVQYAPRFGVNARSMSWMQDQTRLTTGVSSHVPNVQLHAATHYIPKGVK
jgi:hypothetical protein